jgi:hypothetical protein
MADYNNIKVYINMDNTECNCNDKCGLVVHINIKYKIITFILLFKKIQIIYMSFNNL